MGPPPLIPMGVLLDFDNRVGIRGTTSVTVTGGAGAASGWLGCWCRSCWRLGWRWSTEEELHFGVGDLIQT